MKFAEEMTAVVRMVKWMSAKFYSFENCTGANVIFKKKRSPSEFHAVTQHDI